MNAITVRRLFSNNLRRLRSIQNISQMTLAARSGLTHNFINDIENCKKWVSPQTIAMLAQALQVEPYQFFIPESKDGMADRNHLRLYIDDFSNSFQKMFEELKKKYLQGDYDDKF